MLPAFEYFKANSVDEAVKYLGAMAGAKLLAGGTDLFLQMQDSNTAPKALVSIKSIDNLKEIRETEEQYIIGANVTHRQAELSETVKTRLTALHDGVAQVGSVQIRNIATIAGNICNAAVSADSIGPLLVLDAKVKIVGKNGERIEELKDIFTGPGKTFLAQEEILTEIIINKPADNFASAYYKFARRKAMDLAVLGVAVSLTTSPDKKQILDAKIALGTAAPTPIRAYTGEKALIGSPVTQEVFAQAALAAEEEAKPRTSWRSTAEYRRGMINVFVQRALNKALERI